MTRCQHGSTADRSWSRLSTLSIRSVAGPGPYHRSRAIACKRQRRRIKLCKMRSASRVPCRGFLRSPQRPEHEADGPGHHKCRQRPILYRLVDQATLYSKNGTDFTKRFRALRHAIAKIPANSAIIDCELVACDKSGMPCFRTLMELGNKAPALCLWCFDLLHLNGVRITPLTSPARIAFAHANIRAGCTNANRTVRVAIE